MMRLLWVVLVVSCSVDTAAPTAPPHQAPVAPALAPGDSTDPFPQYLLTSGERQIEDSGGFALRRGTYGFELAFYAQRNALRFGRPPATRAWADPTIGAFSVALGDETAASGVQSLALGHGTIADGHYSTAMGSCASTNGQLGAFVYSDDGGPQAVGRCTGTVVPRVVASGRNTFTVRAQGGVTFYSDALLTTGVRLAPGASTWTPLGPDATTFSTTSALDSLATRVAILEAWAALVARRLRIPLP